ncbi:OmpA family protein [Ekhidna sp.]
MKFVFAGISLMIFTCLNAQNLIPNPSFEDYVLCPSNHSTIHEPIKTRHWISPTLGTPDLFSACALPVVSTPKNFAGIAYLPDGNNYVGMYFGSPRKSSNKSYREYLTCELKEQLKKGTKYKLEFFAKPATNSKFIGNKLSFTFSSDSIIVNDDNVLTNLPYQIILVDTLEVVNGWYKISNTFVANGTETFFTIGDFIPPEDGEFEEMFNMFSEITERISSYYLFDDFFLTDVNLENEDFQIEKPFSLGKIYFEFDSFELKETYIELEALARYMKLNNQLKLQIYGNTDSEGSEEYNDRLSIKRAQSVKEALLRFKVEENRIEVYGLGERESIYDFDSLNRRTEFLLLLEDFQSEDK